MPTAINVGANSYVTLAEANTYMSNSVRGGPWAFLSDDQKTVALLTATRMLDRQCWIGAKTNPAQALQWPRTGVVDAYGNAVSSSTVPQQIKDAEVELAFELSQDASLELSGGQGSNNKRLKAGTVEIEYFRPTGGVNGAGSARFPVPVMELVAQFMCGFGSLGGPFASGTGGTSSFDPSPTFGLSDGLP